MTNWFLLAGAALISVGAASTAVVSPPNCSIESCTKVFVVGHIPFTVLPVVVGAILARDSLSGHLKLLAALSTAGAGGLTLAFVTYLTGSEHDLSNATFVIFYLVVYGIIGTAVAYALVTVGAAVGELIKRKRSP